MSRQYSPPITNEIIITAMDRFVWFVLLVVMSHLVTEYTRVIGQNRPSTVNHEVTFNDSYIPLPSPVNVQNMILYPNQEFFNLKQQQQYGQHEVEQEETAQNAQTSSSILSQLFAASANNNPNYQHQQQQQQQQQQLNYQVDGVQQPQAISQSTTSWMSLRPIIDSIFEIPISTLRAVNNLVTRLTGSYTRHPTISMKREPVLPYHSQQQQQQQQQRDSLRSEASSSELHESRVKVKPHKLITIREQNS